MAIFSSKRQTLKDKKTERRRQERQAALKAKETDERKPVSEATPVIEIESE